MQYSKLYNTETDYIIPHYVTLLNNTCYINICQWFLLGREMRKDFHFSQSSFGNSQILKVKLITFHEKC